MQRRSVLSMASAFVLAWVIGRAGPAARTPSPDGGPTAIAGARLIDGTGTAPVDNSIVAVEGDRIRADAKGQVLTPGLVDVHCHLNQLPEDMKRYWMAQLRWGVTTMRSAGNDKPETAPLFRQTRARQGAGRWVP